MKKKISFFIPNFLMGGAENVYVNLANEAIKKQYNVEFVVAKRIGPLKSKINKKIKIYSLNKEKVRYCLLGLKNYLQEKKPNYFFSAMTHCNLIALIASKLSNFKGNIYLKECNNFSTKHKNGLMKYFIFKFLINFFYKFSTKIICLSHGVRKDFIFYFPRFKKKTKVIYNPVDILKIKKLSKKSILLKKDLKSKKIIVSVGRLVKQKNYINLLEALKIVVSKIDCKLLIIGEGPERKNIEKKIFELDLNQSVKLLGQQTNPYKYMIKSDLYVLSSDYEGLGTVLIEAMVLNLPIVSTNCNFGPKEILKKYKKKSLAKVNDPTDLSKYILKKLNQKKIIENVNLSKYSTSIILREYLN